MTANSPYTPEPPVSRMGVGYVLSRSWLTLVRDPILFFGLSVLATLPSLAAVWLVRGGDKMAAAILVASVISMVAVQIIQGAMAYGVYRTLRNEQTTIGEAIMRGMSRFIPLVIAAILVGLGTAIGMMLLIVPGLILMCIWQVTVPACVVERLGAIASMKRSAELTKGHRWAIFGLIILLGLITIVFTVVAGFVVSALGAGQSVGTLVDVAIRILPGTFGSVMTATIYYALREAKEGVTVDSLAQVFD